MFVPLLDLKAQYNLIKDEIKEAIERVFGHQRFILGPEVKELEERISNYCGTKYATGVSSGTDALLLALMSIGIKPGDEIITSTYTFFATGGSIYRLGAIPVFVDIDKKTYNMDPSKIEEKITGKTKALIPVHLFGQMCQMDPIMEIAEKYELKVIEDAAQSIGALYYKRKAGTMGDMGCFSFFPSKNLGACGDGGMIVTNDRELSERLEILRNHGANPRYYHSTVGGNFRLDTIQAAILLVKLKYLDTWSEGRRKNAEFYNNRFTGTDVITPYVEEYNYSIYNQYVIRVKDRDRLFKYLQSEGIGCEIYYPVPLHIQECFSFLGYKKGDLQVAEQAAEETLAIPVYTELTDEQKDCVIDKILNFYKGGLL
ncbi:MAG TPA: DegT/DnrJ/EryC1/StrS family aminotransferase [Candidatus Eremiobacteraeota bacterium]|nr:DegT/DnrJ/EryC1/StrS family aminotransferase [Candidatus Eremiobacteraeota bacterium]